MSTTRLILLSITVAAIYVAVVVSSALGWNPLDLNWDFSNSGEFGDSFGPLSTLMAAAAAVAAIAAYLAQKAELQQAKIDAAAERRRASKRDFEETFFNLLNLFRETVKEIDVENRYGTNPVKGRDAFGLLLSHWLQGGSGSDEDDAKNFKETYFKNRDDLAHYFRLFYHILKFINDSSLEEKALYTRILRATLSNAEIVMIALNCVYGGGDPKLKQLIEKYQILHNISAEDAHKWRLSAKFEKNAFGDRDLSNHMEVY